MKRPVVFLFILLILVSPACTKKIEKIAFNSDRDGNYEIYVMDADGSNQTNLTNNPALDWYSDWSPDGKRIIFGSSRDSIGENDEDIYVMNADGSNVKRLTYGPKWNGFAAWSPDGTKIAFCSYRDGSQDIFTMNADGSGITRITTDPEPDYYPDWSPDGSRIVYLSVDSLQNCEIYIINIDGSNKTNLTNNPKIDGYPAWSPDGNKIAFNRAFYIGEKEIANICLMNPDGSNFEQLTQQLTIDEPMGGGVPRWSSDGSKIVFQAGCKNGDDIYSMNADGTNRVKLTNGPKGNWYACWSPIIN